MNKKFSRMLTGLLSLLMVLGLLVPGSVMASGEVDRTAEVTRQIPYHTNNKPNRLVATINGDPAHERGFNWFSSDKFANSYIEVSKTSDFGESQKFTATVEDHTALYFRRIEDGSNKGKFASPRQYAKHQEYAYKAKAESLEPETLYYYRAVCGENVSDVGSFKTSSKGFKPFSTIHYTDSQVLYQQQHTIDESWYANDTLRAALEKAPNTDLVVHTGDIVEYSDVEDEWYDFLERSKEHLSKTTLAPVPGNHDCYSLENKKYNDSVNFNRHLNVPIAGTQNRGSYYSYDYNQAHFTMVNSNDGYPISEEQFAWIEQDVKAAKANGAKWTVLALHKPLFSGSYHALHDTDVQNVRHRLMKLIDDLEIDLVMCGHDHILSRTHGMRSRTKKKSPRFGAYVSDKVEAEENDTYTYKKPKGTFFVLPGTAGTKMYPNRFNKGLEYINGLTYKFKDMNQEELDEYNSFMPLNIQRGEQYNKRDSVIQNFATYDFEEDKLTCKIWEVEGKKGSKRTTTLMDTFVIDKAEEKKPVDPTPVDPTPVDPTPVDPTPVDPTPVDPTPVDPTPVVPTPVVPTPEKPFPNVFKGFITVAPVNGAKVENKTDGDDKKGDGKKDTQPSQVFEDIQSHWAKDAIEKGTSLGYFKGTGGTRFSPNAKATRAEFITVLYRLSGQKAKGKKVVGDVKESDFYYEPVQWGLETGVISGYEDGSFKGEGQITREEMALMLARFLKNQGKTLKEAKETNFVDQDKIADWAEDAVSLVVGNDILQGRENNLFAPKKTFTRAEMATVTMRLLDK